MEDIRIGDIVRISEAVKNSNFPEYAGEIVEIKDIQENPFGRKMYAFKALYQDHGDSNGLMWVSDSAIKEYNEKIKFNKNIFRD